MRSRVDDRALKRSIGGVALAIVVVLAIVRASDLAWRRQVTLASAERRAANLALILAEYLREDFDAVDRTLRGLVVLSRQIGGSEAPAEAWSSFLGPILAGLPEVGSLTVTDAQGIIRYSTMSKIIGQSRRDRYVFGRLQGAKGDVLVMDTPFRALSGKRRLMLPLARRLEREDGAFDGTVVATFLPEASRTFFKSVDVGREGVLWVFHPAGVVLFREPSEANPLGESARGNLLFEASQRQPGRGIVRGTVVGGPRALSAYSNLTQPPLVVGVSLSEHEILAEWRRTAMLSAITVGVLSLVLGVGFVLLCRQIDARAAAEGALARAQRLEALGQATGGVAHDLNNLLTIVLGNAALLRMELLGETRGEGQEAIDQIERAAQSGADVARRLLAFARRQPLRTQRVDLNVLVARLEPMVRHLIAENIELRVHLDSRACFADLDPAQVETMLMNLCVNARDAMSDGGLLVVATEHVSLDEDYARSNPGAMAGRHVRISVSDTGVGIPPEAQARVFEPFYTTKEPGRGTGLGLSMVYGFVKQSGGHVKLYSEVGHGTTVKVYFPAASAPGLELSAAATGTEPAPEGAVVLLVEDDSHVRELAARLLRSAGYRVVVAADGPSALGAAEAEPRLDLLFTDLVLPGGLDGEELAAALVARRPGLSVLLASGYSESLVRRGGTLAPSHSMISKPFDRATLLRAVCQALRPAREEGSRVAPTGSL